ncbi:MAG: DUF86 domain-containing protein [Deltaproteobacteria bacterium]|nr:DUF86 domain-containing protein [Deltaproteobacteria bacterium]MBW1961877.1 DUF86 domain-containing protein [Deltaproteobacteria bacterium]MBW1994047.1 DUF86 domain-containing protein [Deltaproteobacteria bacterium]MBW2153591.1 DUF86 domain-containing protein [Deltaproteobacteria bacterium]
MWRNQYSSRKPLKKNETFFDFRNSLIHRYWYISDTKLISLIRENKADFLSFIDAIEKYIKSRPEL